MANGVNSDTINDVFRSVIIPFAGLVRTFGGKARNGCKLIPFDTALELIPLQLGSIDDDDNDVDVGLSELRVETV